MLAPVVIVLDLGKGFVPVENQVSVSLVPICLAPHSAGAPQISLTTEFGIHEVCALWNKSLWIPRALNTVKHFG